MGEVKVATVGGTDLDNMATLPVGRSSQSHLQQQQQQPQQHQTSGTVQGPTLVSPEISPECNNVTNKEMEAAAASKKSKTSKHQQAKGASSSVAGATAGGAEQHSQPKRTSLFIIMSFIYAKLLIVICIAYVVSEVVTHSLPLPYYEGFFTYLYGVSILFLLYVFCFLLQESACCQGAEPKPPKQPTKKDQERKEKENKKNLKKEKAEKEKAEKERKEKEKQDKESNKKDTKKDAKKDGKEKDDKGKEGKDAGTLPSAGVPPPPPPQPQGQRNSRSNIYQGMGTLKKSKSGGEQSQDKLSGADDIEAAVVASVPQGRKRKTSQNSCSHGSFFLRVGAIAFGLGTMIYNGLEFGAFFEIPFTSPCYQVLRGVNPVLQMIFTFMQMYFIFMNSRLNIHKFKVIARFGLMHIVATNICVWIRTLVLESLKEISEFLEKNVTATVAPTLTNFHEMGNVFGKNSESLRATVATHLRTTTTPAKIPTFANMFQRTARTLATTTQRSFQQAASTKPFPPLYHNPPAFPSMTFTTTTTTQRNPFAAAMAASTPSTIMTIPTTTTTRSPLGFFPNFIDGISTALTTPSSTLAPFLMTARNSTRGMPSWDRGSWDDVGESPLAPAALIDHRSLSSDNCERTNIMGTIVQDSAPYLFPFIIEYSLIGAAVIYVMWRHIGKNPRYHGDEDLEHRLEIILSRRAVAMAHVQQGGRMDCVGASKGLFLGLLLLVGSLICLILFFVLIHNPILSLLAIYLADVSHCIILALSVFAILIGFIRVRNLKFKADDEQSDLNDILLRVSAFGLFVYAVFSVIAGSLMALTSEPNLLVMITGVLSIFQVVLQLLFIADVSRRRVHLPEHDRTKPGRQIVTFLLIANITMWVIYTFEVQKVVANPVQLDFYGFLAWSMIQRVTLPLCIFHRFHSAVTLAEIWKTSYKPRID